jgi:hypothetical protein
MAQIETIEDKKKTVSKKQSQAVPKPVARPKRRPISRPQVQQTQAPLQWEAPHEELLTAEQWAKKLEEEAAAKAAEEMARPKLMTREEFLAMRQMQGNTAGNAGTLAMKPEQPQPKRRSMVAEIGKSIILDRLMANADSALGAQPKPQAEQLAAQGTAGIEEYSNAGGLFDNMRSNPIIAGGVVLIGLVMVLTGIHLPSLIGALSADAIGLILVIFGGIFMVGHMKAMLKR